MVANNMVQRKVVDPAALTPMEEKIHDLRQQGLTQSEIAKQLGGKWTATNVGNKLRVIREKLACK